MRRMIAALFAVCGVLAPSAWAQPFADMVGTWTGKSETIVIGSGAHWKQDGPATMPRMESKTLTIQVDGQNGRRFWGRIISSAHDEPFVGMFRHHGESWIAVDRDGYLEAIMDGADTFEQCYAHTGEDHHSMVLSCTRFARR